MAGSEPGGGARRRAFLCAPHCCCCCCRPRLPATACQLLPRPPWPPLCGLGGAGGVSRAAQRGQTRARGLPHSNTGPRCWLPHHHERERGPQELDAHKGRDRRQDARAKHEHPEEVGAAVAERPLLQRLAVLDQEEHVEEEIEACWAVGRTGGRAGGISGRRWAKSGHGRHSASGEWRRSRRRAPPRLPAVQAWLVTAAEKGSCLGFQSRKSWSGRARTRVSGR